MSDSKNVIKEVFAPAILAGIAISIGCVVFLRVGSVAGAVLFAFGLLTCVHMRLPLYTGTAGFMMTARDLPRLLLILAGNIVGCALMAMTIRYTQPAVSIEAGVITSLRATLGWWQVMLLAALCGFIMTVAVKYGREGRFLPLLFGVPVFILAGFIHSIADAFYILTSPCELLEADTWAVVANYVAAVVGNFIGCNLYRIICCRLDYPA